METLLGATGIPLHEQILMCEGSRLDATKLLSNYSLPVSSMQELGISAACSVQEYAFMLYARVRLKIDEDGGVLQKMVLR